jgi:hypothetical protein
VRPSGKPWLGRILTLSRPYPGFSSFSLAVEASEGSIFSAMPTKSAAKKPVPLKARVIKPVEKKPEQKKPESVQGEGLRVLKEVLHFAPAQKRPAPDKVEHLVRNYLAKLKEADAAFENGAAVIEKYRSKYSELSSYIQRIVPAERRIEITQKPGEEGDLRVHLFAIRLLDNDVQYEVTALEVEEPKIVKSAEWLSLLHDRLARIIANILYARETSKAEK